MSSARVRGPRYVQRLPGIRCEAHSVAEGRAAGFAGIETWLTSFAFLESIQWRSSPRGRQGLRDTVVVGKSHLCV